MPAPAVIRQLVERFEANLDAYRGGGYNETLLRRDFLDPFFKALGWDIDNSQDYAEAFREVIHEDAIKVGGSTKAPDYSFRIGGRRIFFLEAKKPSVYIKEEIAPAYQLRRYAWSANLPLSILSDFEEFAVYDCRAKPAPNDKPSKGRLLYLTYRDYLERWDEIAAVFSKEAVLKGSFDRYARAALGKRGTATVDAEFLAQIEQWRDLLAKNLALRNPGIGARELNFAVQATIDRIVFLRICEDRGIEPLNRLQGLANGPNIYPRLAQVFREADERYNSGLFHFRSEKGRPGSPDEFTLGLKVDDKLLKDLLNGLYYPESPYEFSVLPADILGQVYERFLGSVIRLTAGGQAKVEEKPEVKKAGGVYYTPTYIVDYIVKQTVGRLLDSQSPKDAAKLKILDPACGSGSFLIGAYQHLLDWHLAWYAANDPEKHAKGKDAKLYRAKEGWRLTASERKRILVNNIYGVDIDAQAVEVTKLSLLLKVLEGETDESLNAQMKLFHERALPDLDGNIKCGNSLIGPDFFDGRLDLDEEERRRINAFDWKAEFPQVFPPLKRGGQGGFQGGFDAVIGNPPYLNIDDVWGKGDSRLQAIKNAYPEIYNDKTDILFYFLAKAVSISKRLVGFIVSRAFLEAYKADKLRLWLSQNAKIAEIVDFQNLYVFPGVGITTAVICLDATNKSHSFPIYKLHTHTIEGPLSQALKDRAAFAKYQQDISGLGGMPWVFVSPEVAYLHRKIDAAGVPLGDVLLVGQGMQTGLNSVFGDRTLSEMKAWKVPHNMWAFRASNSDIQRYCIRRRDECLLYLEETRSFNSLPFGLQAHLKANESALKKRAAYLRGNCEWWRYTWPLHKEWYARPRLLCPYLSTGNRFALDSNKQFIGLTDTTMLFDNDQAEDLRYLLGLLNSALMTFRYKAIGKLKSGGILEYFWNGISRIPVRRVDFSDQQDRARHDRLVALVEQMLQLHRDLAAAKTAHDKTLAERQIAVTDKQIDRQVYELYGLTEEEILMVEGSGASE
jgi:hypothetical protein